MNVNIIVVKTINGNMFKVRDWLNDRDYADYLVQVTDNGGGVSIVTLRMPRAVAEQDGLA